jgi:hypothetical protein
MSENVFHLIMRFCHKMRGVRRNKKDYPTFVQNVRVLIRINQRRNKLICYNFKFNEFFLCYRSYTERGIVQYSLILYFS